MGRRAESIVNVFCVEVVEREMRKEKRGWGKWMLGREGLLENEHPISNNEGRYRWRQHSGRFPCTVLPESGASMVII